MESEKARLALIAREVIGTEHPARTIDALADHAIEIAALRHSFAQEIPQIGGHLVQCAHLFRKALVAVSGDSLETRREAAARLFDFIEKAVDIRRNAARMYMRVSERLAATGFDGNLTIRQLLSGS